MGASKRPGANGKSQPAVDGKESSKERRRRVSLLKQLRKTKFCMYHLQGQCQYEENCAFAHTNDEVQSVPNLRKTRLCKAFEAGSCTKPDCSFAHGADELRSTDMFYKKTLCMWHETGRCRNGDQCRFAHGPQELRCGAADDSPSAARPLEGAPAAGGLRSARKQASPAIAGGVSPLPVVPPASVEPMFVQPTAALGGSITPLAAIGTSPSVTTAPVPISSASVQACLSRGLDCEDILPPFVVGPMLHTPGFVPGLELPHATWSQDVAVAPPPSMGDVIAHEILRALESSQNQLNSLSHFNVGESRESVQADLAQLSQDIQTLSEELTRMEVQLQQQIAANTADGGEDEAAFAPVDVGFSPHLPSNAVNPTALAAAMYEDRLTCMGA